MSAWMEQATRIVEETYSAFLGEVVDQSVVEERVGALSEEGHKRLIKGTHVDARVIRLMAVSGKGGWHSDPRKREKFALNTNVTLLDHLLSVVRGAMLLAALDCLSRNFDMDRTMLRRRLRVIAVLAFLHDLDKLLKLERNTVLPLEAVESAMVRYRLGDFLGADAAMSPEQIRYLIERVEASQTLRSPVHTMPPREFLAVTGYVALADKLDGIWLSSDPEKGGLPGVLKRLREDQTLHTDLLREWQPLELFDPHHPFLMDELQRWLSFTSLRRSGVPPLIEVHQDGRLYVLLPSERFEQIVEEGIGRLCANLPFQLELTISNRGLPALYNGQPDHETLRNFVADLDDRRLGSLFRIKAELAENLTPRLDEMLAPLGLEPRWPKAAGQTTTPYPVPSRLDLEGRDHLHRTAHLVLLLNLKVDDARKAGLPDYAAREDELLTIIGQDRPEWLAAIADDATRRVLTALWISACAHENTELEDAIWGIDGILRRWLEGTDGRTGFRDLITGRGTRILEAVERHFRQLLMGARIAPQNEMATGRCLFTDEPVTFEESIDESYGLYQVRVSAFSGRDSRPESLTSERAHTNVGAVSIAEHKLRAQVHERQGGKPEGVPTLISSPATAGLFGGLGLSADRAMAAMSLYDLSRQEVKKGAVYYGSEVYQDRYRVARFERMAERMEDQVNQLRLLLQASLRVGRPIHVFRGLPTPQRAFFHYDAMPRMLVDLIGGNSLRLEQIPKALEHLAIAQTLLDTNGLGYEVLRRYAAPSTRFGAICLAWCHLRDRGDSSGRRVMARLQENFLQKLEEQNMSAEDGVLVRLGTAAARIQTGVAPTASASEELLVFNLCMNAAYAARAAGQDDEKSLIYAVAGELETNLVRKNKAAARKYRDGQPLLDACLETAELFVREVWHGVLKRRPPSQNNRRILSSIYRMAFLQAVRSRPKTEKPLDPVETEGA